MTLGHREFRPVIDRQGKGNFGVNCGEFLGLESRVERVGRRLDFL
jgi:hypothetical protein